MSRARPIREPLSMPGMLSTQGIEFDAFRWLDFINDDWTSWYLSANLTLIDSEVTIRPQDSGLVTNPTRALQGQADYIFNLQLGFDDQFKNKGSLVYHITGETRSGKWVSWDSLIFTMKPMAKSTLITPAWSVKI